MTRVSRYVIIAVVVHAILCALAGIFVADATLHPQRRPLDENALTGAERVAQGAGSNLQAAGIQTQDRVALKAWLIQPRAANGNAVILLHGLSDNRLGMIGYAELLLSHGYIVLMPDARAHGQSDGVIATYGLLERPDIRQWATWLRSDPHPKCIFGLGESMGAAQLLQSLERDSPFCAVAAESSFSNFREIGYDRVGQFFHTGPWLGRTLLRPIMEVAFLYSRWKYGLDLQQASPEASVANTNVPVLLIHGQIDSNIPLRHSQRIKAVAPGVSLWEVPDADHCGAISIAPEEFNHRLLNWFSIHSSAQPMMRVSEN